MFCSNGRYLTYKNNAKKYFVKKFCLHKELHRVERMPAHFADTSECVKRTIRQRQPITFREFNGLLYGFCQEFCAHGRKAQQPQTTYNTKVITISYIRTFSETMQLWNRNKIRFCRSIINYFSKRTNKGADDPAKTKMCGDKFTSIIIWLVLGKVFNVLLSVLDMPAYRSWGNVRSIHGL